MPQEFVNHIHQLAQRNTCGRSVCNRDCHPLPDDANDYDDNSDKSYVPFEKDDASNDESLDFESDYDSNDDDVPAPMTSTNYLAVPNDDVPVPDQSGRGT